MRAVMCIALAASLAAIACQPGTADAPAIAAGAASAEANAAAMPVLSRPFAAEYEWQASDGAPVTVESAVASFALERGGMASAIVYNLAVRTGDTVTAKARMSGAAGKTARAVLMRHCEPETGEDANGVEIAFDGSDEAFEVSHVFSKPYSCIRLSILSADGSPLVAKVSGLEFFLKSVTAAEDSSPATPAGALQ